MIRYIWNLKDGKTLYSTINFRKEERIWLDYSDNPIFVNILERIVRDISTLYRVKLFYSDGKTFEGWTSDMCFPIALINEDELFDGRFNQ